MLSEPELYFIEPQDKANISGPVKIIFGLKDFGVAPAGYDIDNTGHHHLLINVDFPIDLTTPIPADSNHIHFGSGQTETVLDLPKGEYRLSCCLETMYIFHIATPLF